MGEIKFKAFNKKKNRIETVLNVGFFEGKVMNISTDSEDGQVDYYGSNVDDIALMQYTGLKDCVGTEIYAGDIVAEHGHYVKSDKILYQKIQWKESYSCWLRGEFQRLTPKNIKQYKIEVMGNIYENPELLGE